MRKTFCDRRRPDGSRCGAECVNWTLDLNGAVTHTTSDGKQVGYDNLKGAQLCKACGDELIDQFGLELAPDEAAEMERALR